MYCSKFAQSTAALVLKPNIRTHATRRVIRETPSMPLITATRSFRSIGQLQGQPGLVEAPSQLNELHHGVYNGAIQSSDWHFPPSSRDFDPQQTHTTLAGLEQTVETMKEPTPVTPLYHRGSKYDREPYWKKTGRWKDVTEKEWLSHSWHIAKNVQGSQKLYKFLDEVLPETIPASKRFQHVHTRDEFIQDVVLGIKEAPMSIRLTPHILSLIDWSNPLDDPLRIQFIPMKSTFVPDHSKLTLDSLHEADDSPVQGLVHRYPDKVLFLATSVCGLYCRFCTRSYAVGGNTETITKTPNKPIKARWDDALAYISANPSISDVVVSGGDSYYLLPTQLRYIGDALLSIPHIRRFRIASKGLCVSPSRTLDTDDTWTEELIRLSDRGKERGKQVALHTHFNHVNEMSWVTREAAQKLFERGVVVRNQSVLLRGVNDDVESMGSLIRELADLNIQPYYVYQCDLVRGIEDLRTPLSTILHLEQQLRGSIAGFMMPSFVVDLPGGGGKRLAAGYESYERATGRSTFVAPAVKGEVGREGKEGRVYEYWDPVRFSGEGGGGNGVRV